MTRHSVYVRGFTLIELVMVIFVLGVLTGFAVLRFGDGGRESQVREEAERLAALIRLAREEAILQSDERALAFTRHGYQFQREYQIDERSFEWLPIEDDTMFRTRDLKDRKLSFELYVDGLRVALDRDAERPPPNVFFLSGGELSPFELHLKDETAPKRSYILRGELSGRVQIEAPPT